MRFRATLNNPVGLHKIAQTLERLGPACIVSFSMDCVRFIKYGDTVGGIQAWIKVQPPSLFSNYRIESRSYNHEINMEMKLEYLLRATRAAQASSEIMLILRRKNNQPILDLRMTQETRTGSTCEVGQEVSVSIVPPERMNIIKEPPALETPDAYILMPRLLALKPVAERLKSLSKYLTLSANMAGLLQIGVETELVQVETTYRNLDNPRLEGHQPGHDRTTLASVRIAAEDFVNFLNCYHLEPQNVICAISNERQLAFYVYVNIDAYQPQEAQSHPAHAPQTIMTCHLPVYYD